MGLAGETEEGKKMNHHRRKGDMFDVDTRGKFDTPVMHGTGHKPPKKPSPNSSRAGKGAIRRAAQAALGKIVKACAGETCVVSGYSGYGGEETHSGTTRG